MTPKIICCLGLVLLSFMTAGCSRVVYHDPSFTRAQLESGGLALGAITALGGGEYPADEAVGQAMQRAFQTARPGLTIIPLSAVQKSIDPAVYQRHLKQTSEKLGWSASDFDLFAGLTNQARFILVLDVYALGESSWSSLYDERYESPTYYNGYYSGGGYTEYVYNPRAGAGRWIKASFMIFDTRTRKPVWVAKGKRSGIMSRTLSTVDFFDHQNLIGYPSMEELIEPMARRLSRRLP